MPPAPGWAQAPACGAHWWLQALLSVLPVGAGPSLPCCRATALLPLTGTQTTVGIPGCSRIGDHRALGCQWGTLKPDWFRGHDLAKLCAGFVLSRALGSHKSKQHQGKKLKILFRDTFGTGSWGPQQSPRAQGYPRVRQCPAALLCHHAVGSAPC